MIWNFKNELKEVKQKFKNVQERHSGYSPHRCQSPAREAAPASIIAGPCHGASAEMQKEQIPFGSMLDGDGGVRVGDTNLKLSFIIF